jgi:hypothetical protein
MVSASRYSVHSKHVIQSPWGSEINGHNNNNSKNNNNNLFYKAHISVKMLTALNYKQIMVVKDR